MLPLRIPFGATALLTPVALLALGQAPARKGVPTEQSSHFAGEGYHEIQPGDRVEFHLGARAPRLADGRPERTFHLRADFEGRLQVWASGRGADPFLILRSNSARRNVPVVVENDDGAGEKRACAALMVQPEDPVQITVGLKREGYVEVVVVAAPETEETKATARDVRRRIGKAQTLLANGEFDPGYAELDQGLGQLSAVERPETSIAIAGAARTAAIVATQAGATEQALHGWTLVLDHDRYLLPPDHPVAVRNRHDAGRAFVDLAAYEDGRRLLEPVLAVRLKRLPFDDAHLLHTREALGEAYLGLGDFAGASEQFELVLDIASRKFPSGHKLRERARANVARLPAKPGAGETSGDDSASKTPR